MKQAQCFGIRLRRIYCFMPKGSVCLRSRVRPLRPPHPFVRYFGMTGTPLHSAPVMEKVQSPLRGHRTFSCLSEQAFRINTFHYITGRRVALRATRQPSIPFHSLILHTHSGKQKESSRTSRQPSFCQKRYGRGDE